MKNSIKTLSVILILSGLVLSVNGQVFKASSKSPEAQALLQKANMHLSNIEFEIAYDLLLKSVKLDPDFTFALQQLGRLSYGEVQKSYFAKAKQSAANKSEGEKLFVSLIDAKDASARDVIWEKLAMMYPDDKDIQLTNVVRGTDTAMILNNLLAYVKKFPSEASAYNMLGYTYLLYKKEPATAKTYFEKYIQLYPTGYNPYDSMGEFYFITGDFGKSKEFYTKSLEHYPFSYSSRQKLEEIDKMSKE